MKKTNEKSKRIIFGIAVILYIILIFYLTFQGPKETVALSDRAVGVVSNVGIQVGSQNLRSFTHIPLYFGLGCLMCCFVSSMGWKSYIAVLLGCLVGFIDESLKILLPTREFDFGDLLFDVVGVVVGVLIVHMVLWIRGKNKVGKHS